MVVGNGLLATAFDTYVSSKDILIFASGISNSKSGVQSDYDREKDMLSTVARANTEKQLVYFSTTSIADPDLSGTPYVLHKLQMEELVSRIASRSMIFRLSNLAGVSGNKNTVLNFFNDKISAGLPFACWSKAERNIIDVIDVFRIAAYILNNRLFENETVNIANVTNYPVPYIISCLEIFHQKSAKTIMLDKGMPFKIDVTKMRPVADLLHLHFGENYLPNLLKKYFSR